MRQWICDMCGYAHYGKYAPSRCPKCGASGSMFFRKSKKHWEALSILFIIFILASICFALFSCSAPVTVDNSAVASVNLNRYMGKWYELARFDHSFEKEMTQCTATYTLLGDGKLEVTNRGMRNGEWKTSTGKGRLTEEPGVLRVSFFGPFYSDYRIMMLAPDYSYALVGGDSDNYLWILSRTPKLKKDTLDKIIQEAVNRGYNTSELLWVEQETRPSMQEQ